VAYALDGRYKIVKNLEFWVVLFTSDLEGIRLLNFDARSTQF
jgi:hypothetical protein